MNQLIESALRSESVELKTIAEEVEKLGSLLIQENSNYGSAVFKRPILTPRITAEEALYVRLSDKIGRVQTILGGQSGEVLANESLVDSLRDLAGCSILLVALYSVGKDRADSTDVKDPLLFDGPVVDCPACKLSPSVACRDMGEGKLTVVRCFGCKSSSCTLVGTGDTALEAYSQWNEQCRRLEQEQEQEVESVVSEETDGDLDPS